MGAQSDSDRRRRRHFARRLPPGLRILGAESRPQSGGVLSRCNDMPRGVSLDLVDVRPLRHPEKLPKPTSLDLDAYPWSGRDGRSRLVRFVLCDA